MGDQADSQSIWRFIKFRVADTFLCVRMDYVRGIKNAQELRHDVKSPVIVGWLPTEAGSCQVLDISNELFPDDDPIYTMSKILIVKCTEGVFGLLVEEVENIFEVKNNQVYSIPKILGGIAIHFFDSVISSDNKLILALEPRYIYKSYCLNDRTSFSCNMFKDDYESYVNLSLVDHRQKKIVIFSVTKQQDIYYGLSVTQIPQILQLPSILKVPRAGSHIIGVLEWRGIILPIVDLSLCIENKKSDMGEEGRVLVVRLLTIPLYIAVLVHPKVAINSFPLKTGLNLENNPLNIGISHKQFSYGKKRLIIPNIDSLIFAQNEEE